MTDSSETRALAIDGGGTRSRFLCQCGTERFEVERGAANAFSDFDGTVSTLRDGLAMLARSAGLSMEELGNLPASVGLAGMIDENVAERLAAELPLKNVEYADDRRAALRGAFGASDGVIAHCGTGSFLAAQINGDVRLAGGWGYDLGDEASAQWVGRQALSRTLRWTDGFDAPSALYRRVSEKLEGAVGILNFVAQAAPRDYGTLAPIVTELAAQEDSSACAILQEGAAYISGGIDQLGWVPGRALCLSGGIGPHYAPFLPSDKQQDLTPPRGTPLDGALDLACERYREQTYGDC